jgi:hypothetical protein
MPRPDFAAFRALIAGVLADIAGTWREGLPLAAE